MEDRLEAIGQERSRSFAHVLHFYGPEEGDWSILLEDIGSKGRLQVFGDD